MLRSKAQYIVKGEKPTKYFCELEKHNYISKIICKIEKEDGTIICDQEEILLETKKFYENLYKSKDNTLEDIDLENYMRDTNMMKITEEESNSIEGLLTYKEIL